MMHTLATVDAFRDAFWSYVEHAQHIVITAHYSPDDDSIGSVLSTYLTLSARFPDKKIRVVYTGEPVVRYQTFKTFAVIEWVDDIAEHLEEVDLLLVLDVNRYTRISKHETITTVAQNIPVTIAIDHHGSTPDTFTLGLIDTSMSSNAELLYRVYDHTTLTKELAELFLLGIVGDTGNFSYVKPTQADVFLVAKKLLEIVDTSIDAFRARYSGIPKEIIPLLQELVAHMSYVTIAGWLPLQYSYLSRTTVVAGEYSDEDISAASHIFMGQYLNRIEGYSWGIVATPRSDGSARISGRSLPGSVNVRKLFEGMSIGGGHDRASGGYLAVTDKPIDGTDAIAHVTDWMKHNEPTID